MEQRTRGLVRKNPHDSAGDALPGRFRVRPSRKREGEVSELTRQPGAREGKFHDLSPCHLSPRNSCRGKKSMRFRLNDQNTFGL